jgi:hypothetical protein
VNGSVIKVADKATTIPGGSGTFVRLDDDSLSIDDGKIAFFATGESSQEGVYLFDAGTETLSVVADLNTPIPNGTANFAELTRSSLAPTVSEGRTLFWGTSGLAAGLYLHDGQSIRPVIETGTLLDDRLAFQFIIGRQALSGNKMAFLAGLYTGNLLRLDWSVFVGRLPAQGDADGDDDVDLVDFRSYLDCTASPGSPPLPTPPMTAEECLDLFDLDGDGDGDVDLFDLYTFLRGFTGGGN